MFLKIHKVTESDIDSAKKYFPKTYTETLEYKFTFKESLTARYLISQEVERKYWIIGYLPQVRDNGQPIYDTDFFWCISHRSWIVFVWVSEKRLWVDLDIRAERGEYFLSTFSEVQYEKIGGRNWDNFYILWTAGESIIKCGEGNLDTIWEFQVWEVFDVQEQIEEVSFQKKIEISIHNSNYIIYNWLSNDINYSFCIQR